MSNKYYLLLIGGINMVRNKKLIELDFEDKDFGILLQLLEDLKNFYPCYKTLLKK
jgi:hypothetical protein